MNSISSQKIPFYQVDAFAPKPFSGNPAAVFLCDEALTDEQYLNIAREMYLPETTFLRPLFDAKKENWQTATLFEVRWFMVNEETNLCGHATLAAAHVIFEEIKSIHTEVTFRTRSGNLLIRKEDFEGEANYIKMQFPVEESFENRIPEANLLKSLGVENQKINSSVYFPIKQTWILEFESQEELENLKPNFEEIIKNKYQIPIKKVGITTKGNSKYDFISRLFCPWIGINEDALSAVSHGLFAKYWQPQLNKNTFFAYQASKRGGEIHLQLLKENGKNNQVLLIGKGITTLEGNGRI
ncbi:phenazine biosynthesis protein PhzF family [Bernardetia litoralis DSM 6794]|uniref:Phenazine biosynthesis protein PhzF family n=1 Tax=Bernardetia litoralis (strain ATCC 23117 / DSM 6794 / NBRC 15988 / NCIMB 1366 / Fx l1 / Sio-4) TaxID=880071 RepID=I4AH65_BERLS|nr:PhzF family phenazine biosynthesis isomerase [Bernardetia litoralis]AFM03300.1 phenazine biosynthesis protein PhzF family [Bernardetia litoralis DSM 6794]